MTHPRQHVHHLTDHDTLPSYTFNNGTGVRCHVAGWGKDEFTGNFQFIQHKVETEFV